MSLYYLALNNNQKTYLLKITNFTFIMRTPLTRILLIFLSLFCLTSCKKYSLLDIEVKK